MPTISSSRELGLLGFIVIVFTLLHLNYTELRYAILGVGDEMPVQLVARPGNASSTPAEALPPTTIVQHVPGWTVFERLYIMNGTLLIVTDEPDKVPPRASMTSTGVAIMNGAEMVRARTPTDKEMHIISVAEAATMFGGRDPAVIDGTTFMITENQQFLAHYYHFVAEVLLGLWRTYAALDPSMTANGTTFLSSPARFVFVFVPTTMWRDYAHMNEWVVRAAFPSAGLEFSEHWLDRAATARPFVFERVVLGDRAASFKGTTGRMSVQPFLLKASPHWWTTVRANVAEFAGIFPQDDAAASNKGVITYISRQEWGRRTLKQADHEVLVSELKKLEQQHGYEVNVVTMEELSREEQIRLAARTTIMMGVHGNGLTSLLWMKPTPRSAVMEFFYPEGFVHDYEWITRTVGITHYAFWGNRSFESPNKLRVNFPDGFQGEEIPIDGAVVARLCHERLALAKDVHH